MIEVIDNHSVRTDLLTKGPVLDAGARGFVFSKYFADRGHSVIAIDPSPDLEWPHYVYPVKCALVGPNHTWLTLIKTGDPGAWYVTSKQTGKVTDTDHVDPITIGAITCWACPPQIDVVKLNIEGSEYDILENFSEGLSENVRQIVVSFHEHTPRARGRAECDRLIEKMRQWYTPFNVVWEKRYCCAENYWDVLFIRNDLV